MNASTFTARVIASTGADSGRVMSGAIGALSGPLHGGAPARVLQMLDDVEATAIRTVRGRRSTVESGSWASDIAFTVPRILAPARSSNRRTSQLSALAVGSRARGDGAQALAEPKPDRVLATNVEFWSAVILTTPRCPSRSSPIRLLGMAGWSAHILEQADGRRPLDQTGCAVCGRVRAAARGRHSRPPVLTSALRPPPRRLWAVGCLAPMFERFTEDGSHAVALAQEEARQLRHDHIGTEHLLLGLLRVPDEVPVRTLAAFNVDAAAARQGSRAARVRR